MLTLAILCCLLSVGFAQIVCPQNPSTPSGPFYLHANGFVYLGWRAQLINAVAQTGNVNINNGVSLNWAWSGRAVEVGWFVDIRSNFLFVPTLNDAIFEINDLPTPAVACITTAPPACDDDSVITYPCTQLEDPVDYDTALSANVNVYPEVDQTDLEWGTVPVIFDGTKRNWRDLNVAAGGIVAFTAPGVYKFRRVDLEADVVFWLGGDGDYQIYVEDWFDAGERFVICNNGNSFLVYQNSAFGHVHIGNAPANRDHELQMNIIARTSHTTGGYVFIGLRQTIRGYISTQGDIAWMHDADQLAPSTVQRGVLAEEDEFAMDKKHALRPTFEYGNTKIVQRYEDNFLCSGVCDHDVSTCDKVRMFVNRAANQGGQKN